MVRRLLSSFKGRVSLLIADGENLKQDNRKFQKEKINEDKIDEETRCDNFARDSRKCTCTASQEIS